MEFRNFLFLAYRWTPIVLRISTGLTGVALLVCAGWVVCWVADVEQVMVSDGLVITAVIGVIVMPLFNALLIKSYVAFVRTLHMFGDIREGSLKVEDIRQILVRHAGLRSRTDRFGVASENCIQELRS